MLCIISFTISTLILCAFLYLIYGYLRVIRQISAFAESAFSGMEFEKWKKELHTALDNYQGDRPKDLPKER